jgi:hypothetical protein
MFTGRLLVEGMANEKALVWSFCTIPLISAVRKDRPMSRGQMIVIRSDSYTRWAAPAKHPYPALCCLSSFDFQG